MRLSVITRTRNRPMLLQRAANSVANAATDQIEWVIVDDAASVADETRRTADEARRTGAMQVSVHCSAGGGRTAAANLGLREAAGEFVHFHDDDDTVEPDFYRAALDFLCADPRYGAVRAMCTRVHEEISDGTVRMRRKKPIYPERRTVSLLDAAEVFAYPPIGSVFRRQTLIDVGGFDERFDVGEDYDLLLRFLMKADMGTIPRRLANVHVRKGATDAYANSPIERRFAEEHMLFVNAMLRRDLESGRFGVGHLLALGQFSRKHRSSLDYLKAAWRRLVERI